MIDKASFNKKVDGQQVALFELRNKNGLCACLTNYGAKIVSLEVPNKAGQIADVLLGFDTLDEWLTHETYFNAVVGRFANRIKDGRFTLDGHSYQLAINNGTNHLHGGRVGFNQKVWTVLEQTTDTLRLQYISPDGEEGYPGTLTTVVTYRLDENNALSVHYEATTDKPTIVGFTQHAYFNLAGAGSGTVHNHMLQVAADWYLPTDDTQSPTGAVLPVDGTPMDFRQPVRIGERADDLFFALGRGIDNAWLLRKNQQNDLALAGTLSADGRTMQVLTTLPSMQVYTGNWVEQNVGKNGHRYDVRHAVCMEAQGVPNSPNLPHLPTPVLRPNGKYDHWCICQFV